MQWSTQSFVYGRKKVAIMGASTPFTRDAAIISQCTRIELMFMILTRFSLSCLPLLYVLGSNPSTFRKLLSILKSTSHLASAISNIHLRVFGLGDKFTCLFAFSPVFSWMKRCNPSLIAVIS